MRQEAANRFENDEDEGESKVWGDVSPNTYRGTSFRGVPSNTRLLVYN